MLKFNRNSPLRLEEYDQRIRRNGYICIDRTKLLNTQKYMGVRSDTLRYLAKRTMNVDSGNKYIDMSRDAVKHYLIETKGVPIKKLTSRTTGSVSLDAKQHLKPLLETGHYAATFLEYYIEYKSIETKTNRGKGLLASMYPSEDKNHLGRPVHRLNYDVQPQENLRYNYNNEDLISIPREYGNSFTVEDGYVIVSGDLKQSDWRIAYNLFIRDERNEKIMASVDDQYEGIARVLADFYEEEFDIDNFKEERDLYKVNVLETIYGKRSSVSKRDAEFIRRFAKYLDTCPRYQDYIRRVKERRLTGLPIPITGFFGVKQNTENVDENKTVNKALNTPIQTGTSQIVILIVNTILDKFYELGYTEDDVNIYMVRHDEPVFKIKETVMKDAWVFEECSKIIVENWTPIELEFSYSRYYKEPDLELHKLAKASIEENFDKITYHEPDTYAEDFSPVAETLIINVGYEVVGDKCIFAYYEGKENKVKYRIADSADLDVVKTILATLCNNREAILEQGYSAVVAVNSVGGGDTFEDGLYMKATLYNHVHTPTAFTFAHYMAAKYSKKYGIDHEIDFNALNQNKKLLESAGDLDVIQV